MFQKWFNKEWLGIFGFTSLVVLLVFRNVILTLDSHLLDSFDFPYYAWVLNHALSFLLHPASTPFADTNAYFPTSDTYFFSDLLLPQALIGIVPKLLGFNPIAVTNSIFLTTIILNAATITWFWQTKFTRWHAVLFATLTTTLSPFLFTQLGHLQMLALWPFFLSLALLSNSKKITIPQGAVLGLLWVVQFLASFYLSVFLLAAIGWFSITWVSFTRQWKSVLFFLLTFGVVAALLSAPFLMVYVQVKQANHIKTSASELITFAAHPTDYLFIGYPTVISTLTHSWQKLNHHNLGESASYPGTATLLLGIVSLFTVGYVKKKLQLSFTVNQEAVFFFGLLALGFIFSLGPRLSFNGAYVHLPLPYWLVLKVFPFLETVRASARWSFFFHLGLTYFAGKTLTTIKNKKIGLALTLAAVAWFLLEMIPWNKQTISVAHALDANHVITETCHQEKVLAILPFTEQHQAASLTTNLARKTGELLRSTIHQCKLLNGYGGFEPAEYTILENQLNQAFTDKKMSEVWQLLLAKNTDLVYLDTQLMSQANAELVNNFFQNYASLDMANPPITVVKQQANSWYLVELNRYDTVNTTSYGN